MKYNISNLVQFKSELNKNVFESMTSDIAVQINQLIDNQVKGLIKPYVEDIENLNMLEIATILAGEDLELLRKSHNQYDKFILKNTKTGEEDYFTITQPNINITENNGKYEMKTYFSDIVRGIKDR